MKERSCRDCRGPMISTTGDWAYAYDRGAPITLRDVSVQRCTRCPYQEVVIPRPGPLHATIKQMLAVLRSPNGRARRSDLAFFFEEGEWGVTILALNKSKVV